MRPRSQLLGAALAATLSRGAAVATLSSFLRADRSSAGVEEPSHRERQIPIESYVARSRVSRQEMQNFEDMQYYSRIVMGGQEITGIIDTGSFELVIFEKHCQGCGLAGKYDRNASNTSRNGILDQRLYYGSGDIWVKQAFDMLAIGNFPPVNQTFWEGSEAHMPVLEFAKFESIIGVGPPETPANDFWEKTKESIGRVRETLAQGIVPPTSATKKVMEELTSSVEMTQHKTLISQYNIATFSICLGKRPRSPGYFVWNDTSAVDTPAAFKRVKVIGRHTWTLNMTHVQLTATATSPAHTIGCTTSCGAVVDSGTSLLMMPTDVVDSLETTVQRMGIDCHKLHELPEISFHLDGHHFTLPPDAYLSEATGTPPSFIEGAARMRELKLSGQCQVTVMESFSDTNWGPLWILGMPFFRKYYTIFNIGRTRSERALYIAPATSGCTPASPELNLVNDRKQEYFSRRLNLTHMYLPPLVRKAATSRFVHL